MPFTLSISRAQNELGYQSIVTWEGGIAAMWLSRKVQSSEITTKGMRNGEICKSILFRAAERSF
jgi:hypothetical protein